MVTRAGHDSIDMDDLLAASVLDDIETRHWTRYKMTWPPNLAPSDTLISRIVRELKKRTLSVQVVFKVRTQAHQQKVCASALGLLRAWRWSPQQWIEMPRQRCTTI